MSVYYLHRQSQTTGPFPIGRLARMIAQGEASPDDLVCPVGQNEWMPLEYALPVSDAPPPPRNDAPHCVTRPHRVLALGLIFLGVPLVFVFFPLGIAFIVIGIILDRARYHCGACGNKVLFTTTICPSCRKTLVKK